MREEAAARLSEARSEGRMTRALPALGTAWSAFLLIVHYAGLTHVSLLADEADLRLRVRPVLAFSNGPVLLEATLASRGEDAFEVGPVIEANSPTDTIVIQGPSEWGSFSPVVLQFEPPSRTTGSTPNRRVLPTTSGYWIMPDEQRRYLLPVHAMFDRIPPGPARLVVTWNLPAIDEYRTAEGVLRQTRSQSASVSATVDLNLLAPTEADVRMIEERVEDILKQHTPSAADRHFALAVLLGQKGDEWMPLTFDLLRA
jgi:hypothetical protein